MGVLCSIWWIRLVGDFGGWRIGFGRYFLVFGGYLFVRGVRRVRILFGRFLGMRCGYWRGGFYFSVCVVSFEVFEGFGGYFSRFI